MKSVSILNLGGFFFGRQRAPLRHYRDELMTSMNRVLKQDLLHSHTCLRALQLPARI